MTVTSGFPDDFSRYTLLIEPDKNGMKVVPYRYHWILWIDIERPLNVKYMF